jgi:hypothetical protein
MVLTVVMVLVLLMVLTVVMVLVLNSVVPVPLSTVVLEILPPPLLNLVVFVPLLPAPVPSVVVLAPMAQALTRDLVLLMHVALIPSMLRLLCPNISMSRKCPTSALLSASVIPAHRSLSDRLEVSIIFSAPRIFVRSVVPCLLTNSVASADPSPSSKLRNSVVLPLSVSSVLCVVFVASMRSVAQSLLMALETPVPSRVTEIFAPLRASTTSKISVPLKPERTSVVFATVVPLMNSEPLRKLVDSGISTLLETRRLSVARLLSEKVSLLTASRVWTPYVVLVISMVSRIPKDFVTNGDSLLDLLSMVCRT